MKKVIRGCSAVDVEIGQEVNPVPIGLQPQALAVPVEVDEGLEDPSPISNSPPEVSA